MTLPYERTNAVLATEKFLLGLIDRKVYPDLPKKVRDVAHMLLRHYPHASDLRMANRGWGDATMGFVTECPFADPDE